MEGRRILFFQQKNSEEATFYALKMSPDEAFQYFELFLETRVVPRAINSYGIPKTFMNHTEWMFALYSCFIVSYYGIT